MIRSRVVLKIMQRVQTKYASDSDFPLYGNVKYIDDKLREFIRLNRLLESMKAKDEGRKESNIDNDRKFCKAYNQKIASRILWFGR